MDERFQKKKYLGQHFLSNKNILEVMIRAAEISKNDIVLEVGPGTGTLTQLLAQRAKKIIAVEKDRELIPYLREKFKNQKNVKIIEGDILKLAARHSPLVTDYKIVANIPYYITSRFLRVFLEAKKKPALMVLMIQHEVARRIVARDNPSKKFGAGKESLLSLSVKAYGTPTIIRKVPKGIFSPPPKVDSAIIKIDDISGAWFNKNRIKPSYFFEILRRAFQKKRNTLKNSIGKSIQNHELDPKILSSRPEDLSLDDWASIVKLYTQT